MSGARHRYACVSDQVEDARKQTRLEALGEHFRVYTAPAQAAHLPCIVCATNTLRRVQMSSLMWIAVCGMCDAWDAASLFYVEQIGQDEMWDAYQARRSRDGC